MTTEAEAPSRIPVCGIGASAGGVEALQQFFRALPPDLGVAYVVVVHLAPDHKSELPAILARWTSMPVIQVGDHRTEPIRADHVYVIAPDRKLEITDSSVGASAFDQPRGQRTAIDLFFRSLAHEHGDGFAVLLSGSGSDGALGARAVKERGGLVLVQDPHEAQHGGMPRAAIATGVADVVLPVRELAVRLGELARSKRQLQSLEREALQDDPTPADDDRALRSVLAVVRQRTGHDFSRYKRSTVLRRLTRRMQLAHRVTFQDYLGFLRASAGEPQALLNDLLISVTMFFRDPEAWAALQTQVIAPLVERADADTQLRIWVAGCASGEEAYTVAILFFEEFERRRVPPNFVVFASDVDDAALMIAREGVYPQAISADVSDDRLQRFFRAEDDHYRVSSDVRDHIVFASHSLLRDAPFSRVNLVCCRNLLIYLDRELQEQVMGTLRYACRDDGTLFLGSSESASDDWFFPVDKKHHIFGMRPRDEGTRPALPEALNTPVARPRYARDLRMPSRASAAEIHASALEEVGPPSVVVDERWNVLHVSPTAPRFFQQSGGALARRLTDLVRPELRDEVHALLQQAIESAAPQLSAFMPVQFEGATHSVAVLVQQRLTATDGRRDSLVVFLDAGPVTADGHGTEPEPSSELVRTLREKLRQAEQRVEAMRDEHHLTTEDLRAANEELQSLNEEYRSTTEELETSKEELQSINEELQTVNHELKAKLEEVSRAHGDLENLMAATQVATLFLTPDLRIKRFTPRLGEIFKIKSRDVDRPIADLKHTLDYDLEEDARTVLATVSAVERETRSDTGSRYVVRLGPYRTVGGRGIDGVVVTFIDVTAIKTAEEALRASEARLAAELTVIRRLHAMTLAMATAPNMPAALDVVLAAAIELHGGDRGHIRLPDRDGRTFAVVAHQGFEPAQVDGFTAMSPDEASACGRALRTRQTVQVDDVLEMTDAVPERTVAAGAYRAVQATPLIGTDGAVVGVLSVHVREVHRFSERDRQLADVLGRIAADLIESRAQHENLRQLNESLQRRTAELEEGRDRLARQAAELTLQDQHREDFLAALGHELRNPLAAIQGSAALISPSDDRSRKAVAVLGRQTRHMTRLINDLLDVTRVRHGRVRLERTAVDIRQALTSAADTARPLVGAKPVTITCALPDDALFVEADAERLAQVLDNLVRNAITYTAQGSITLSVTGEGSMARVNVRDTGIGLDAREARTVFEPYRRGRNSSPGEGLGLGLTLVKSLVEAHGGTIDILSDGPGTGCSFTFTLPLARLASGGDPRDLPPLPARRRVLVVDDQRDVADTLAAILQGLNQDVSIAYDAGSAIAIARKRRPELALLDVSMPGTSGSELARQLRRIFPNGELTIVAISGHDRLHARVQDGPFDRHLLKPATTDTVITLLNATRQA